VIRVRSAMSTTREMQILRMKCLQEVVSCILISDYDRCLCDMIVQTNAYAVQYSANVIAVCDIIAMRQCTHLHSDTIAVIDHSMAAIRSLTPFMCTYTAMQSLPCPCAPTQRYNRCHSHVHPHSDKIAAMPTHGIPVEMPMCAAMKIAVHDLITACEFHNHKVFRKQ